MTELEELAARQTTRTGVTDLTRVAIALAIAKGTRSAAAEIAAARWSARTWIGRGLVQRAAPTVGDTATPAWAGVLSTPGGSEFMALLRPRTIIGRLSLRAAPFLKPLSRSASSGVFTWVSESAALPFSDHAFALLPPIPPTTVEAGSIITAELAELSDPDAERAIENNLLSSAAVAVNKSFIDPAQTGSTGVQPAAITAGAPSFASAGDPMTDVGSLIAALTADGLSLDDVALVMSPLTAFAIASLLDIETLGVHGGTLHGMLVVTAPEAADTIVGVHQSQIAIADAGIGVDVVAHATIDSREDPNAVGSPTLVSLWQRNLRAIRTMHRVGWLTARADAVAYIKDVLYLSLLTEYPDLSS